MDVNRFVPRLEEIEARDTPSATPAAVFDAFNGIDYITAALQRYVDRPEVVQSPTTQTRSQAQLTTFAAMSDAYAATLDDFLAGLQAGGGVDVNGLAARAQAEEAQARSNAAFARGQLAYIAANPAPTVNAAVISANGQSVTVFGPSGTPTNGSSTTPGTGTTTTTLPGTTTNGGVNLGNLFGGNATGTGGSGTATGTNTGAGTGTGTGTNTTGTGTTTGTTSGTNTGTNGTGSTSDSGSTTGTSGTTSSTATP